MESLDNENYVRMLLRKASFIYTDVLYFSFNEVL
jgi:hypothetical protein